MGWRNLYHFLNQGEELSMFTLRKKNKFYHQDRIAMRLAARSGLTYEYKLARRHRLTPIDALEDWDMLYPEDYKLFEE